MLSSVVTKTLRDQRRAFVGWSVGLALIVMLMASIWPTVRDMPDLDRFLQNYPEAMRELFDIQSIGTGSGYMNAELFTMIVPLIFLFFGVGRGARLVGGEEEDGLLEILLVMPVSRTRILLEKAVALVTMVVGLGVVLFLVTLAASVSVGLDLGVVELAGASVAMVLLGVEFGLLALGVGAVTGSRAAAIGGTVAAAVAAYVLYIAGELVTAIEPWKILSPFDQALAGGPLGSGFAPAYAWLVAGALVVVASTVPVFARRDITV